MGQPPHDVPWAMRTVGIPEFINRDWPIGNSTFGHELSDVDHIVGMKKTARHCDPGIGDDPAHFKYPKRVATP